MSRVLPRSPSRTKPEGARARSVVPRTVPPGALRRTLEAVQRFRANFVFGALLVLFAALLLRLGKLQLVEASHYRAQADERHHARLTFDPARGKLLDVHRRVLATGRQVVWVGVDPRPGVIEDVDGFAQRLSGVLEDDALAPRIAARIRSERERETPRGGLCVLPAVEDRCILDRLDELRSPRSARALGLYGVLVEDRERRFYPNGSYAAHVLGQDGAGVGVEAYLDDLLDGNPVSGSATRDGLRRLQAEQRIDRRGLRGRDARLTIDIVIQHAMETALDRLDHDWRPHGEPCTECVGIAIDPRTGHVLALACRPGFDPNRQHALENFATRGLYEPGSAFKPFTVAQALTIGVVGPDEILDMPSTMEFLGVKGVIHDSHPVGDGDVVLLLSESSNVGAAQLAFRLGTEGMRSLFRRLVHDAPTGIELPGEKGGTLGEPRLPPGAVVRAGFGQGFTVTPIQLASWFCAFARDDGLIVKPTLLPGNGGPRTDLPPIARPDHLAVIRRGLAGCVDTGTAEKSVSGGPYLIAGKTGTAQRMGTPYLNASFVGYAPRDRPQVVVLVLAKVLRDEERKASGGSVAGPAVRYVVDRTLEYWKTPPSAAASACSGAGVPGSESEAQ